MGLSWAGNPPGAVSRQETAPVSQAPASSKDEGEVWHVGPTEAEQETRATAPSAWAMPLCILSGLGLFLPWRDSGPFSLLYRLGWDTWHGGFIGRKRPPMTMPIPPSGRCSTSCG